MPFDVDLTAGPLNICNDFRVTWRTALRWDGVAPGQTWRHRRAARRGGSGEHGEFCEDSPSPLDVAHDYVEAGKENGRHRHSPKGASARQKPMQHSRSEPGLPTRLPALQSAFGPLAKSERLYGELPTKRQPPIGRARSHPPTRLPALVSSPQANTNPEDILQISRKDQTIGRGHRRTGRSAVPGGVVDEALSRSRKALAGAATVLAESRSKSSGPLKSSPTKSSGSTRPMGECLQSDEHALVSQLAKQMLEPQSRSEQLQTISVTANRIFEELDDTCKLLHNLAPEFSTLPLRREDIFCEAKVRPSNASPKSKPSSTKNALRTKSPQPDKKTERRDATEAPVVLSGTGDSEDPPRRETDASGTGGTNQSEEQTVASDDCKKDLADDLLAAADSTGMDPSRKLVADPDDELAPAGGEPKPLTEAAIDRLKRAFHRFTETFSYDLDTSYLAPLLKHLGHGVTKATKDAILQIVKEVTPYEYLDYDEFQSFFEKFLVFEHGENRKMFDKFDTDGSDELSVLELRQVMSSLDILPLNGKVKEALGIVDKDCNGQLGFAEFALFLQTYQTNEGFTAAQIAEFREIHAHYADGDKLLPLTSAADALVCFYGVSFQKEAKELAQQLLDRHKTEGRKKVDGVEVPEGLRFDDLLLLARQLREILYVGMGNSRILDDDKREFAECDADGSGKISREELFVCIKKLKYSMPLDSVVEEVFDEVFDAPGAEKSWSHELDFDHFFDFMLLFRQREGFLKSEVEDLFVTFTRFDDDHSGEISTLELGDIFRHLGYVIKPETVQRYVLLVDENCSHTLDFKEFLHLMQMHRCTELTNLTEAFNIHFEEEDIKAVGRRHVKDAKHKKLSWSQVVQSLGEVDYKPSDIEELIPTPPQNPLNFGAFVQIADRCRTRTVEKCRRMAGFNGPELERLENSFNTYDKDHSGTITCHELMGVLQAFGWKPKTREDRSDIMGRLEKARVAAKEAGVEESTPDGSADLNFWEFVQLARMIQRHDDAVHEDLMAHLAIELDFTNHEAAEFHDVFLSWAGGKKANSDDEDEEVEEVVEEIDKVIHKDESRRLVKTLGVKFTQERKRVFEKEITVLVSDGNYLDFPAFLRLMRWLLDAKFLEDTWTP